MDFSPKTRPVALIGSPVMHSLSPKLHNAIYDKYNLDLVYLAFHTEKENLTQTINSLKSLKFVGFNVTVPFKRDCLDLVDELDKESYVIGAVNTVKIEGDRLLGFNTDGAGFIDSLKNRNCQVSGMNTLVIGAGGSARAICAYLAKEKAETITVLNRTASTAEELVGHIKANYSGVEINTESKEKIFNSKPDLIINTTSLGMWPKTDSSPFEGYDFSPNQIAVDIVYNPLNTKFLQDAEQKGCKVVHGLNMLVGQAVKAIEIWTGTKVDFDFAMRVLVKG